MRTRVLILPLAAFLSLNSLEAQTGDWKAVKNLPSGSPISIQTHQQLGFLRVMCLFSYATDRVLVCQARQLGNFRAEASFARQRIRQVRLEHGDTTNMAVGGAIGGGVGAAIGAGGGNGTLTKGGGALLIGTIGAITGGSFGRDFPVLHRRVVYQR